MNRRGISGGQSGSRVLIHAASAIDSDGEIAPAAILLEGANVVQAGAPASIGVVEDAHIVDARSEVVMPGLVNSHAHLDLSGPGPLPFEGDFEQWLEAVIHLRTRSTAEDVAQAVDRGIALSLAGGTAFVGDIAGMPHRPPIEVLRQSSLGGVSYAEFFGLGDDQPTTVDKMITTLNTYESQENRVRLGLSPHAPYTCGLEVMAAAADSSVPIAIHVAESRAELEFLATGSGPFRTFADMLKTWNDGVEIPGKHPIEYALSCLGERRGASAADVVFVHLNYLEPDHLEPLHQSGITPVYCPRASAYFGYPDEGRHPYKSMLDHGIPVALGTDSLLCLDTPDRISVLDEMRFLFARDAADPVDLMKMATSHGARALGIDAGLVDFKSGEIGGILAVPAGNGNARFTTILNSSEPPRWLLEPISIP